MLIPPSSTMKGTVIEIWRWDDEEPSDENHGTVCIKSDIGY